MNARTVLGAALLVALPAPLTAQEKPVQVALVTPLQIVPEGQGVRGIRINLIYGRNTAVSGLDIGLVNQTTRGPSLGLQWGLVGLVDGDFTGWQDDFVSVTRGRFTGFQSGAVNSAENGTGFQWGAVNIAQTMSGLQLGLVNYAARMNKGVQIGIVNIIKQGGVLPVMPIVNWSF